ncbi:related to anon-37cs protein [Rhynchosporium secalis]|uniref:Related to anon-37cs protein n=1 Tax=Rhynchosporium secalis TaxID=38038 RepID=A0A1E1M558_RHYSE|nr:related to anon-37cs protein [Rhynchosporium secalis]
MDFHKISHTLLSHRSSSRIYQDLAYCRSTVQKYSDDTVPKPIMESDMKFREKNSLAKPASICIVGAGISGLRCADVLLQNGFDVTILEARDRIGGRVTQQKLSTGHLVDLGANWIHGTESNPILDLAKATNTATHDWSESFNIFDEDGKLVKDGKELNDTLWGIIVQAFKHSAENTATIDPKESLYDFFLEKVQGIFPSKDESKEREIMMQMTEMWGAFVGSPVQTQSLKFFWLEECIDGENLFCAGTYQKILGTIAKSALAGSKLKLSTKVTSVETHSNRIIVSTENGDFLEFGEIIITCPLGWLQKNKKVFNPELPARFSQAIDAIGYGTLEKVYITFPRAFWLGNEGHPDEKPHTGFTQWTAPAYTSPTNPERWNQEVVDLATLPGNCAHPTLLFYLYGAQSVSFGKELSTRPTEEERNIYLASFFKPYYSLLPHYDADSVDCAPLQCLATTWILDDLAGNGSYTTIRTGVMEADKDIEIMREGLPGRSVWFAGEHTAPFFALGTVTGAYWSGENVARRIVSSYGMEVIKDGGEDEGGGK